MSLAKQKGIALFTTLVLLVIVTLASVVLIRNASFESKMTGAYADQSMATGEINGAVEEVIGRARQGGVNPFIRDDNDYLADANADGNADGFNVVATNFNNVSNNIQLVTTVKGECFTHVEDANSQEDYNCRIMTMDSSASYSRSSSGQVVLTSGVVHIML